MVRNKGKPPNEPTSLAYTAIRKAEWDQLLVAMNPAWELVAISANGLTAEFRTGVYSYLTLSHTQCGQILRALVRAEIKGQHTELQMQGR